MRAFRFIHAADLHLDSPFKGLSALPAAIRGVVRESTFVALQRLVDAAIEERADFVLIAGDVYDAADRSLRAQLRFQSALAELADAKIPVYVVHGNHDPDDGRKAVLRWPASVRFFASAEAECVEAADRSGRTLAYIHGWSYPKSAVTDNPLPRFGPVREGAFNIGLLHTNADGDAGHDNYAPCTKQELISSAMNYWALGHIHSRRIISESPAIVYPGNLQGRSVKESGAKGCYVVDVSESGGISMRFRPTDALRWHYVPVSIEGLTTEQELRDRIEERLRDCEAESDGRPSLVRIRIEGRGPLHRELRRHSFLQELAEELREEERKRAEAAEEAPFTWLESFQLHTAPALDYAGAAERSGFVADLLRLSAEAAADETAGKALLEQALRPLLDHPRAGSLMAAILEEEGAAELLKAAESLAVGAISEEGGWDE